MSITVRTAAAGDGAILHAMVRELAISHGHEHDFTALPSDYERFLCDPAAVNGALIADKAALRAGAGDEIALLPPVSGG